MNDYAVFIMNVIFTICAIVMASAGTGIVIMSVLFTKKMIQDHIKGD